MRKLFYIFCISIFLFKSESVPGQSTWIVQNPTIPSGYTKSIKFINQSTGFVVMENNVLLHTTNQGLNWNTRQLPTHLYGLYNYDENLIVISGDINNSCTSFYKTTNSGNTWSLKYTPYGIHRITFYSSQIWYASTGQDSYIKTTNGGDNWSIYSLGLGIGSLRVSFINTNTGYVCGRGTTGGSYAGIIGRTTNGGTNWSTLFIKAAYYTNDMIVVNDSTICAVGYKSVFSPPYYGYNYGLILFSNNSGYSFDSTFFATNTDLTNIVKITNSTYISYSNNLVLRSNYSCRNWYLWNNLGYAANSLTHADGGVFFAGCDQGKMLKTTNDGASWIQINKAISFSNFTSIAFKNENTGIAVSAGDWPSYDDGIVIKTTNGGVKWDTSFVLINRDFLKVQYIDDAFFINTIDAMYTSMNDGIYWANFFNTWYPYDIITFDMVSNSKGFIGLKGYGDSTVVFLFNGGLTPSLRKKSGLATCIKFKDANTGICATTSGVIYRTSNSGVTWDSSNIGLVQGINNIHYLNNGITYANTRLRLFVSLDYGINWQLTGAGIICDNLHFTDELTGYSVFENKISKTINGGVNWQLLDYGYPSNYRNIWFLNQYTGWVVGNYGTILKTSSGGVVGTNQNTTILPDDYVLLSNFPNPFNSSTLIKFRIPEKYSNSDVELSIYNILGKEVYVLNNFKKMNGAQEVSWTTDNLTSGIYFIRLRISDNGNENLIFTRKAVLLK